MSYSDTLNSKLPYAFGGELAWLRDHARNAGVGVMIGAGPGIMGIALLEGNPHMELTIIDIDTCYFAQEHMKDAGFTTASFVVSDSAEYGEQYAGDPIDLLIIDGDHSKVGVLRDLAAWFPHVRNEGLIFFHDVVDLENNGTNGVLEAIQSAEGAAYPMFLQDITGTSRIYRKNIYDNRIME